MCYCKHFYLFKKILLKVSQKIEMLKTAHVAKHFVIGFVTKKVMVKYVFKFFSQRIEPETYEKH